jgi:membrane protease YdiL (CAAX protease family)
MKVRQKKAAKVLLAMLSIVIFLHLLIILKIVPYAIAWGGRLQNDEQMYMFETVSILINLILICILLIKGRYVRLQFNKKILNLVLWIFFMLFILNTVGNLFAQSNFEKLFAVVTLTLAILIWIILRPAHSKEYNERLA